MADYFSSSPNFVNPAYATPEQLATQRAYAAALQKQSDQTVNRPTGALANGLNALTAALVRNNANEVQSQAAQGNANDVSALISQLQSGQKLDPQTLGHLYANPMASPEARALVGQLITPQAVKSEFGQPGTMSPAAGIQAMPIRGPFTPGYRVQQGAEGVHTDAPVPAPGVSPTGPAMPPAAPPAMDGVSPQGGVFGGMNSRPVGWNAPPAGPGPTAPASAVPNRPMTLDELAAKGREFASQKAFTQGTSETQTGVAKQDIAAASDAPTIKRVAGVMLDDLNTHGGKMPFGPTANWQNEVKRVAADLSPGLMKDQLSALASADSFDKMSAQLTSLLASRGGTDAQLFNNMRSVPGSHNSQEGAKALLQMTLQVADQQQALRQFTSTAKTPAEYEALRNDFYKRNPIINPITNHPIALDVGNGKGDEPPIGTKRFYNGSIHVFKGGNWRDKNNWEQGS